MDIGMDLVFACSFFAILGLLIVSFKEKPQIVGRNEAVKRMLAKDSK